MRRSPPATSTARWRTSLTTSSGSLPASNNAEHFLGDDERVVVLTRVTTGDESADQADVLTYRDGKVVKFQSAGDTPMQERIWGSKQ